jgi:imidazole glycerol-phosphate synthase subunit HisH
MAPLIGIVDYGRGNLRSVQKALETAGARTCWLPNPEAFASTRPEALVLPGVGSFGDCANSLEARGLFRPLRDWLEGGRPFLGICLGYQILFESSEESPGVAGLGFWKGVVRRFPSSVGKIPHMGWNELKPAAYSPLLTDWSAIASPSVYFVHSFYPEPEDRTLVTAWCDYGGDFAAAAGWGAVQAFQFHPEKSQATGLHLLRNFVATLPPG